MSQNKTYLTKGGIEKLQQEINHLRLVEAKECIEAIADSKDKGDVSENSEFDIANERYDALILKINKLTSILSNVSIIDITTVNCNTVQILTTVFLKDVKNNKTLYYTIVPAFEQNIIEKKISVESPVAKSLLNKSIGDLVKINVPIGHLELEILDIKLC